MALSFNKATKKQARARIALIGPSGAGKTYTALALAAGIGGRVAVIDTERGSASKYSDLFDFDVLELETFAPRTYIEAIQAAGEAGYTTVVVDSLSHAWMGKGGALEMVDAAGKRAGGGNSFSAWRDVTPQHNALVDAMLASKCHVIATIRAKTEYVQEKDERGRTVVRKVGLAPVQRDGLEYEFDIVGDVTSDNDLIISKTRLPALSGGVFRKAGADVAATIKAWLTDGAPIPPPRPVAAAPSDATATELQAIADAIAAAPDLTTHAALRPRLVAVQGAPGFRAVAEAYTARKAALAAAGDEP